MLTGDDLSVQLFIFGGGISFAALAVSQAGWTHKAFVASLFSLAMVCFIAGAAWSSIKAYSPALSDAARNVAGSSLSWFALIAVAVGAICAIDIRARLTENSRVRRGPNFIVSNISLRFSGELEPPTAVLEDNILSWFAFWTPSAQMRNAETGEQLIAIPPSWAFFISFKEPTSYHHIEVTFSGARPSTYEVRQALYTSAVITVSGGIPACEMRISARS